MVEYGAWETACDWLMVMDLGRQYNEQRLRDLSILLYWLHWYPIMRDAWLSDLQATRQKQRYE